MLYPAELRARRSFLFDSKPLLDFATIGDSSISVRNVSELYQNPVQLGLECIKTPLSRSSAFSGLAHAAGPFRVFNGYRLARGDSELLLGPAAGIRTSASLPAGPVLSLEKPCCVTFLLSINSRRRGVSPLHGKQPHLGRVGRAHPGRKAVNLGVAGAKSPIKRT